MLGTLTNYNKQFGLVFVVRKKFSTELERKYYRTETRGKTAVLAGNGFLDPAKTQKQGASG